MKHREEVTAKPFAPLIWVLALAVYAGPLVARVFDPMEVRVLESSDGFSLESPLGIETAATLRVVGPQGEVFEGEFREGETVEFFSNEVLDDGSYRWEVIYRESGAENQVQGDVSGPASQWRANGLFEVISGAAVHVPLEPRNESSTVGSADPEGELHIKTQAATNHNTGSLSASGNACVGDSLCTAIYQPNEDLEIMDDSGNALIRFLNENDGSPTINWYIGSRNTGDFGLFETASLTRTLGVATGAPANSLFVSSNGFVGIGTAAPAGELHIQSSISDAEIRMTPIAGSTWRWYNGISGMWLNDITSGTTPFKVSNTAPNDRLVVESSGNLGIGTTSPSATVEIEGNSGSSQFLIDEQGANASVEVMLNLVCNCSPGFRMQNTVNGEVWFFRHTSAGDFSFDNVGNGGLEARLDTSGNLFLLGSLSQGSSRSLKDRVELASGEDVLATLADLDLYEWSYRGQGARHFGPMAEEFSTAYGLGESSAKIAPSDMAGLALAAAKTLSERNSALAAEKAALVERVEQLESLLDRVAALEEKLQD